MLLKEGQKEGEAQRQKQALQRSGHRINYIMPNPDPLCFKKEDQSTPHDGKVLSAICWEDNKQDNQVFLLCRNPQPQKNTA